MTQANESNNTPQNAEVKEKSKIEGFINFLKLPGTRKYFYRIIILLIPILGAYGIINSESAPQIIALIGAILGLGVADRNINHGNNNNN